MSALIEIEKNVVITALQKQLFHFWISNLKSITAILHSKMQLRYVFSCFRDERRNVLFKYLDCFFIVIIQNEKTLDIQWGHAFNSPTKIEGLCSFAQHFDKD